MVTVEGRNYHNIEQWQVDYIKEHFQDKYTDISEIIGVDTRRIGEIVKLLGFKRVRHNCNRVVNYHEPEIMAMLQNPFLSHAEIAEKFGVTPEAIGHKRKTLGIGVRKKNYDTVPEQKVARILDELDLAYDSQKRVDKWSIDFYLGCKHCIDVHGTWAHEKPIVKDRDVRKKLFLEEYGYRYLVIHEYELDNIDAIIERVMDFTQGFPRQ